jgi:hypothetical protein
MLLKDETLLLETALAKGPFGNFHLNLHRYTVPVYEARPDTPRRKAPRLRASAAPVLLTLANLPAGGLVPGHTLPFRPIVEVVEAIEMGFMVRLDGAFPDIPREAWTGIPNEPVTLDAFMARFCEKRSGESRRYRRHALLGAARNGKVTLPPAAGPHRSGQSKKYFPHDLLAAWQGFIDEDVDLPPLLADCRTDAGSACDPATPVPRNRPLDATRLPPAVHRADHPGCQCSSSHHSTHTQHPHGALRSRP